MSNSWTVERLKALPPSERHKLYKNCRTDGGEEALSIIAMIEKIGLPFSSEDCVSLDDPLVSKMHEIINSPPGVKAMLDAQQQGLPPLAGVDPFLASMLGVDYGKHNMTTHTAGQLVVERMQSLGFKKGAPKALPANCVARSAVTMRKN